MAIIIPSSKIYAISNEKISINKIDKIDVSAKRISVLKSSPINYSEAITPNVAVLPESGQIDIVTNDTFEFGEGVNGDYFVTSGYTTSTGFYTSAFLFALNKTYYQEINISIPTSDIPNYASAEGQLYATINVNYALKHPIAKVSLTNRNSNLKDTPDYEIDYINIVSSSKNGESFSGEIPTVISISYGDKLLWNKTVSIEKGKGDIGKIPLTLYNGNLVATAYILCGGLQASGSHTGNGSPTVGYNYQLYKEIECNQYVPQTISLTVNGEATKYDVEDAKVTVGNAISQNSFKINSNELLQEKNYWIYEGNSAIEKVYSSILPQYKNGKETATLKCSFGDYFDENGVQQKGFFSPRTLTIYPTESSTTVINGITWQNDGAGTIIANGKTNLLFPSNFTIYKQSEKSATSFDIVIGGVSGGTRTTYGMDVYTFKADGTTAKYIVTNGSILISQCYGIAKVDLWVYGNNTVVNNVAFTPNATIKNENRAYFEVGDIVIPQKYAVTIDGLKDVPMSTRIVENIENPKSFFVIGVNFIFDGASWQELILEEYS